MFKQSKVPSKVYGQQPHQIFYLKTNFKKFKRMLKTFNSQILIL